MRFPTRSAAGAFATLALLAFAEPQFVAPPENLQVEGVAPIPEALAKALEPYGEFRPHAMLSWHPQRREILVRRRLHATNQVHAVRGPGAAPMPLTDYPDAVNNASYPPSGDGSWFLFARAVGGNEEFRLYREDVESGNVEALSPAGERVSAFAFARRGDRIAYATQLVDRNNPERRARTTLHLMDPRKPRTDRIVARFDGGGWFDFRFSEDGRRLAFVEYVSANESHLWVLDLGTGKRRRVTRPGHGEPVAYGNPHFTRDGKALFATSDRGSEFRRLVLVPLSGRPERVLTPKLAHDIDDFAVSFDAERLAFTTNENGSDVLRFIDLKSLKELPRPPLVQGVIGGLHWRPHSTELAFHITSARSAGDVFTYDVQANKVTRWTNGNSPGINTSQFVEPRMVHWKSFDGLEISGFHYHPPARFTGKRPVIVNIHGGPEGQARPGFIGRNNYFVGELGVAMIYPNVRGSSGFGKSFLKLDNGRKREDSVKDIGALLDWIAAQPDLDASRVMILGGSYGGYMTLACASHFADRIASAESVVGISNFVTFLEHTESYRRDLRRAEYGDERDPAMRAFLESISPLTQAARITKPLFAVQGRNDPRVPYTEAGQIVATVREKGTPVWFVMARDEGHGFVKKPNADFLFYATVQFARETLLK